MNRRLPAVPVRGIARWAFYGLLVLAVTPLAAILLLAGAVAFFVLAVALREYMTEVIFVTVSAYAVLLAWVLRKEKLEETAGTRSEPP